MDENTNIKPPIKQNYSIREILKKYEDGIRTPEIVYLKEEIDSYKNKMDKAVGEAISRIPSGDMGSVMKWIASNLEGELAKYVRLSYLGQYKDGDVLKRSENTYKTVSQIGIVVENPDSKESVLEWKDIWRKKAVEISQKLIQYKDIQIYESHAHYNLKEFKGCSEELVSLLHASGISNIVIPAIEFSTVSDIKALFDRPEFDYVHYAFGSHPKYIWKENWDSTTWENFETLISTDKKCVAVGETGLDYSYEELNEDHRNKQIKLFAEFIKVSNKVGLPVVLHIRPPKTNECKYNVHGDALAVLKANPIENGAVLHCFGGGPNIMREYMKLNSGILYFGIGGRVFKEQDLMDAVREMPEDALILETDAPYISISDEKRPNTSLSLYEIAEKISEIRGCGVEHILRITHDNATRLFSTKR